MPEVSLSEQALIRREKLAALQQQGKDPFHSGISSISYSLFCFPQAVRYRFLRCFLCA